MEQKKRVPSYGRWGTRDAGIEALEEFYYIFRDEIPETKFKWESFFAIRSKDGRTTSFEVKEGVNVGQIMIRCLLGEEEYCGSRACVAGWAITTHPHLLRWEREYGVVPADWDGSEGCPSDAEAFAMAFGIETEEAWSIIYGFEDEDEEGADMDQAEFLVRQKNRALEKIRSALIHHGRPDPEVVLPRRQS